LEVAEQAEGVIEPQSRVTIPALVFEDLGMAG
jgi:hypothetical protein